MVHFVVTSDDWAFADELLAPVSGGLDIVKSLKHTGQEDFALLLACNAVLMSTGSFGWWAGWIVNTTTVYYKDWPRNGSNLGLDNNFDSYFPPYWIPMM